MQDHFRQRIKNQNIYKVVATMNRYSITTEDIIKYLEQEKNKNTVADYIKAARTNTVTKVPVKPMKVKSSVWTT